MPKAKSEVRDEGTKWVGRPTGNIIYFSLTHLLAQAVTGLKTSIPA